MVVPLRNRYRDIATPLVAEWTSVQRLLRTHAAAWRRLVASAIEPNAFYAPEYLEAATKLEGADIRAIAVFRDGSADSDMVGLFPLARARFADGALIPAIEMYRNDYVCLTAPLVAGDDPVAVWEMFFDRLAHSPDQPRQIISRLMPADAPVTLALHEALARRNLPLLAFDAFERAMAVAPEKFEDAFRRLGSSRRTSIGRRRRRLRKIGDVTFTCLKGADGREAVDEFLRIEASGWKGRAGTAMNSHGSTQAFARSVFTAPEAEIDLVSVDGTAIAAVASVVAAGTIFTVKTGYDEQYGPYSPGLLLNVHMLRRIAGSRYRAIDSCAVAEHAVNDFWLDRKTMTAITFASHPSVTQQRLQQSVSLLTSMRRMRSWIREMTGR